MDKDRTSKQIRKQQLRIKQANSIKKEKVMEFKAFYVDKFEPISKRIIH